MREIEYWIGSDNAAEMYSSAYWNNVDEERQKEWWVIDGDSKKLTDFLTESGLLEELEAGIKSSFSPMRGKVLDLAAGTCWTSAVLSKQPNVESVDAVEFSLHRIRDLAEATVSVMDGNSSIVNRIYGSFYDIKRADGYYDYILLSQAFHHAKYPLKLFAECDRVLKNGGEIIMIGEPIIDEGRYAGAVRDLGEEVAHGKFYNHDCELGDHRYRLSDHQYMYFGYGYEFKAIKWEKSKSYIFVGKKPNSYD